jgi:hypothetical protein
VKFRGQADKTSAEPAWCKLSFIFFGTSQAAKSHCGTYDYGQRELKGIQIHFPAYDSVFFTNGNCSHFYNSLNVYITQSYHQPLFSSSSPHHSPTHSVCALPHAFKTQNQRLGRNRRRPHCHFLRPNWIGPILFRLVQCILQFAQNQPPISISHQFHQIL